MLSCLAQWLFGVPGVGLSAADRQVSAELRRLKTLRCEQGRVSIDPIEVLTPEYLQLRRDARRLVR